MTLISNRLDDVKPSPSMAATHRLEGAQVAPVQGAADGLSPHIRLSFATSLDLPDEAIARIAEAIGSPL